MRTHDVFRTLVFASLFAAACSTTTVNPGGQGGGATSAGATSAGSQTATTSSQAATNGSQTATSSSQSGTGGMSVGPSTSVTTTGAGAGGHGCDNPISTEDCDACADGKTCADCCINFETAGNNNFNTLLEESCACPQDAPCFNECNGNACPGMQNPPSADCFNCLFALPDNEPCYVSFTSDCNADQDCALLSACLVACPA